MAQQVAFVTGSTRGIGLAAAKALAAKGFAVAINGPADDAELDAALAEVSAIGAAMKLPMDVSDISGFDAKLTDIENTLGPLTTLVNNAGVSVLNRGDMLEVSEESFDRCLSINTKAMFFLNQSFSKRLLARKRDERVFHAIVNVTSSNARAVALPRSEYAISKAAAAMVSQSFAARLGAENIHVYDLQPGLIETDMTKSVIAQYKARAEAGLTLLPRIGTPEDMGAIIANLASGAMPYVTGQVISADGGLLLSRY